MTTLSAPRREDTFADGTMNDEGINRILTCRPFDQMKPAASLREILRIHTRIVSYQNGDIVVRKDDYGNSAFVVLSGTLQVLTDHEAVPDSELGRSEPRRRRLFETLAQMWRNHRQPEVRNLDADESAKAILRDGASGDVRVSLKNVATLIKNTKTVPLGPGQIMGEIAALTRTARTATVFSEGESELLEIRWQGLRDIMRREPKFKKDIDDQYRPKVVETFLLNHELLGHLSEEEKNHIIQEAQFGEVGELDWHIAYKNQAGAESVGLENEPIIVQEGHVPTGLIMILSGFARVSHRHGHGNRTVGYLGKRTTDGEEGLVHTTYGLEELTHNWRHPDRAEGLRHSLRAVGYTAYLMIPAHLVEQYILGPDRDHPLLPPELWRAPQTEESHSAQDGLQGTEDLLEFVVENRLVNGTKAMVINLDRCTQCDECVKACASTHDNNPRFIRHGPAIDNVMVANACMHCADPVCLIGCPTGAIHRDPSGIEVKINDPTCIGCGACADSCPYDNIRMVEIRDQMGNFILDQSTHAPRRKATKCDLCASQMAGPACQRACPNDALVRIDMNQSIEPLASWIGR